MSRYDLVINGNPYRVEIGRISGTGASVTVNGVPYEVEIPAGGAAPTPTPAATPAPAAPPPRAPIAAPAAPAAPVLGAGEVITAPMPGHILSVAVKVGDAVEVGDTVLVMEAMKMENEIKAHVAGTVSEVKVAKGQDVGVGEVLMTIGG
ncbi:MAG: biotin/lipoyl-containing protein [Deferrisomatales bacterium]|nr:biotin/lipoyl-containing protein [Deferrisomatales bacterium]